MSYATAAAIVLGAMLSAAAAAVVVRRRVRLDALKRHHEVGSAVFLQMGVIYAVLLAFVFTEVWSEYNAAAQAISEESSSLVSLARLARSLPDPARDTMQQSIAAYLASVTGAEWPAMRRGAASEAAEAAYDRIWQSAVALSLPAERDQLLRSGMLAQLAAIQKQRRTRLFQMGNGVPRIVWVLLISYAVALAGFLLFFGVEYIWSQALFTGVFAAGVAFVLVLIQMLDYPFAGALGLTPAAFEQSRSEIAQIFR